MTNLLISLMNDLPMHPIPECLRLFQINRDGPATVSCAEGARCSSLARQRGAPPSFHASKLFGSKASIFACPQHVRLGGNPGNAGCPLCRKIGFHFVLT